jgi:hypothetical protein
MPRTAALMIGVLLAGSAVAEPKSERGKSPSLPLPVRLEDMPAQTRDALTKVMKDPTVTSICKVEEFIAHPDTYHWLLDNPDRTATAWRKLGVGAVEIKTLKDGRFFWKDETGSELVWQTVAKGPKGRVWYAEGQVKPGPLLPTFPVTAVAVLAHSEQARATGDSVIKHQLEVFLHTDSKAAALVTRVLGDSAPKMAQQGSDQLLMFFSGIAKYVHDKPEKSKSLLSDKGR